MKIKKLNLRRYIILLIVLFTSCTTTKKVNEYSNTMAVYVKNLQKEINRFSDSRDNLVKARMNNILTLERSIIEFRQSQEMDKYVWNIINNSNRTEYHNNIIKSTDLIKKHQEELEAHISEQKRIVAEIKSNVEFKEDKLSELSKLLVKMSKKSDLKEEMAFYTDFFKTVKDSLDQKQKEADKALNELINED